MFYLDLYHRSIKEILHPKMKIQSSFTHPQVVVSFFCWTQRKMFWRTIATKQLFGTVCFHSRKKKYYASHWFQSFFKISSFVFSRRKKLIQVTELSFLGGVWKKKRWSSVCACLWDAFRAQWKSSSHSRVHSPRLIVFLVLAHLSPSVLSYCPCAWRHTAL